MGAPEAGAIPQGCCTDTATHVSESSSVAARSLLLGFSMAYSTRSQSSNVRWVCCWRDVISIRRRTLQVGCLGLTHFRLPVRPPKSPSGPTRENPGRPCRGGLGGGSCQA